MATSWTTNIGIGKPALNDPGWTTVINANFDLIDSLMPIGGLAVRMSEIPSASLNVRVGGGSYRKPDGSIGTFSTTTIAATASATSYVYLSSSYALTVGTGWPSGTYVPIGIVVAGSATITSVTDARVFAHAIGSTTGYIPTSGGSLADAANLAVGTSTGTQIGTAAAQKLGFFGATPVVQPSGSSEVAVSTPGMASPSLASVGATNSADVSGVINSNFTALNAQLTNGVADIAALRTLVNSLQAALVSLGLIKGSA